MSSAAAFRAAMESWNIDAVRELLAPNAVFNGPVAPEPVVGRDTVAKVLALVGETFEGFHYTDELEGNGGAHALVFKAKVGDAELEGVDLIRLDEHDLIASFTVMIRPISGLIPFAEAIGPKVAAAGLGGPPPP